MAEEQITLASQFTQFAKMMHKERNGQTITLSHSDYWLRQGHVLDDRKLTMVDTGNAFIGKYKRLQSRGGISPSDGNIVPIDGEVFCNATFDSFLCWPPTPAGAVASQHCPPARLSDTSRFAFRRCGETGKWLNRKTNESSAVGWTNYTPCFPPEVQTLFIQVYDKDETDPQQKFEIAQRTRDLEIVGFSISLIALLISLFIFSYYRSLHNNRTKIHKHLFIAMIVQVVIRLIVYIDQALIRSSVSDFYEDVPLMGIDNMPYVCEASYVLLEYASTAMFMWMFIEGLYLHNVVTGNVLRERISHVIYYATGWGLPVVVTAIWATTTAIHYQREPVQTCWYGYNFSLLYWIIQGPRVAVIMINLVFLLNIIRVLIVKLRRSQNTEVEKVRKAVRAALVLLPLLGITNALNMTEAPLDGSTWEFGLWSYSTHFLRSFQGFFIALIYCFLNGEVRQVVKKHYQNFMAMRGNTRQRRHRYSLFQFMSNRREQRRIRNLNNNNNNINISNEFNPYWIRLRRMDRSRDWSPTHNMICETEIGPEINQPVMMKPIGIAPEAPRDQPKEPEPQVVLETGNDREILEPTPVDNDLNIKNKEPDAETSADGAETSADGSAPNDGLRLEEETSPQCAESPSRPELRSGPVQTLVSVTVHCPAQP